MSISRTISLLCRKAKNLPGLIFYNLEKKLVVKSFVDLIMDQILGEISSFVVFRSIKTSRCVFERKLPSFRYAQIKPKLWSGAEIIWQFSSQAVIELDLGVMERSLG